MWLGLVIGLRTKHWVQASGIQQGGEHTTQGYMSSFLLLRLSKAVQDKTPMLLVNVMCTTKVNLSALGAALFFARSDMTHSYQPDANQVCIHKHLALRLLRFAASSTSPSLIQPIAFLDHINLLNGQFTLFNKTSLLDVSAAAPGGDDIRLASRVTPNSTEHNGTTKLFAMLEIKQLSPQCREKKEQFSTIHGGTGLLDPRGAITAC